MCLHYIDHWAGVVLNEIKCEDQKSSKCQCFSYRPNSHIQQLSSSDDNTMHLGPITSPRTLLHERVWLHLQFHQSLTAYNYDYEYTMITTYLGVKLVIGIVSYVCLSKKLLKSKKVRIHGNRSRVRVGRGHIWGYQTIWAGAVRSKTWNHKKK